MIGPDLETYYYLSVMLLLMSVFVSSVELIRVPRPFLDIAFPITGLRFKSQLWTSLHTAQGVCALICVVAMILGENNVAFWTSFLFLATCAIVSYLIRKTGKDGADQFRVLAVLAIVLCGPLESEMRAKLFMGFIGFQLLLSYTTSAVVKLLSPHWRKGHVLADILSTSSFGFPAVAGFLYRNRGLEKFASHSAIVTMLLVPVCFFIPSPWPIVVALGLMFLFHFTTAVLMGLNDFLYTLPVAYPGVICLHTWLTGA